jgi:hypothetical protein
MIIQDDWPFFPDDVKLEEGIHRSVSRDTPHIGLHLNAGGDFFLMARSGWDKIRGHGERPEYNSQLDGVVIAHAAASGLKQIILTKPYFILHMDHGREENKGRPEVAYMDVHREMLAAMNDGVLRLNDENWGFARQEFNEWRGEALKKSA